MEMTTKQVALKLGIHRTELLKLVKAGKIATTNKSENGKRVAHMFDPRAVREFKRTYTKTRATKDKEVVTASPGALTGIVATLERLEATVEKLAKIWS